MTATAACAPGKVILFGEHAVVYGRPAIAVPVTHVQAKAVILASPAAPPGRVEVDAPGIGLKAALADLPREHPLRLAVEGAQEALQIRQLPAFRLRITSTIPIASGLGSGAAVSVAVARAVSAFLGQELPVEQISAIAYRVDQAHHGTPSGIDNTVIAYAQPIFFVRGQPFERLQVGAPFTLVIGDSGLRSPTVDAVAGVRLRWQADSAAYEAIFDQVGGLAREARRAMEAGQIDALGPLMIANHALLQRLEVSCPELDRLVQAALAAGAHGAKLSGAGRGGNMIALASPESAEAVAAAIRAAGAVNTIITRIE